MVVALPQIQGQNFSETVLSPIQIFSMKVHSNLFLFGTVAQMTKTRCSKSVKASGRQAFALVP